MANPDLIIRVAANIAALQADMAAAVATIKAIEGAATATAGATAKLASASDSLGGSWVARIAEGVLLRDAIRGVLSELQELAVGIPNEARDLRNLSLQTQINVEDLQVLTAATREYGVDGEQLGRALFQLGQRIAGGDASVATAYHLMGMSLDEVRSKNPVELFLATERGLGTLSGAIQDTAAKDLYGARLGASLIAFSHGADEATAKARELTTIAGKESLLAAAAYADAIDRATHSVHALAIELEGKIAQGVNVLTDAAGKGASIWQLSKAALADWVAGTISASGSGAALATVIDHLNQNVNAGKDIELASAKAHDTVTVALTAQQQAARFMAATELDSAKPLLAWQVEYLGHLKEIGILTAQNAAGIGVSSDQLKRYEADRTAAAAALVVVERQVAEVQKASDAYYKAVNAASHDSVQRQIDDANLAADAQIAAMTKSKNYSVEAEMLIWKAAEQTADNIIQKTLESDSFTKEHYALIADQARIAYEFALDHVRSFTNQEVQLLSDAYRKAEQASMHWAAQASADMDKVTASAKPAGAAISSVGATIAAVAPFAASITNSLQDALTMAQAAQNGDLSSQVRNVQTLSGQWITAAQAKAAFDSGGSFAIPVTTITDANRASLIARLKQIEADYANFPGRQQGVNGLTGLTANDIAGWSEMLREQVEFASLKAALPGYAAGVRNAPGGWATVGERGPETMFVPAGANIFPNGSGAGTPPIHNHFNITYPLGTPHQIAEVVGEAIMDHARSCGIRFPSGA